MKIERDKWYLTRSGEKVRVICVDANHPRYPVVAVANSFLDGDSPYVYTADGIFDISVESGMDLISEYVEPPKPKELWVRKHDNGYFGSYAWESPTEAEERNGTKLVLFREVIE